jgi:hypothetical protein
MSQNITTDLLAYLFLVVIGLCFIVGGIVGMLRSIDKPKQRDKKN